MIATASQPYAERVADYALAGWNCILPVPPASKTPPPVGFTGDRGRDTEPVQLVRFASSSDPLHGAASSIALRMPEGVIGIDVDEYAKTSIDAAGQTHTVVKNGAAALAAAVEKWGPLPPTWCSTSRGSDTGPGESRILLFRAPAQRYATKLGSDIDIIQRHHRYAVVWPSVHHYEDPTGSDPVPVIYRWYDPSGHVADAPPRPADLAVLPRTWAEGLAESAAAESAAPSDVGSGQRLLEQLLEDWRPECADVTSARLTAIEALSRSDVGGRHDVMIERTHHLVQLAATGHTGAGRALAELREAWAELTAGENREEEFERALLTTARKAVTSHGAVQVPNDPCLLVPGFPVPPLAAADPGNADPALQVVAPPRWTSVREVIGADAFDPIASLDQPLAEAVLARTYPALRHAYDANAWLLRCPERWELHGRMSPWAVAQVAPLMPVGDITAEKGSDAYARAQRRARLLSTAGSRAVAGKMDDLVSGGMHPAAMALTDLDADPDVLWAGGQAWSLRESLEGPVAALIDPATPHLHSAGVTPARGETPLWDAFLAAVWPDPEVRAWALRVLSIAATGHADRALPILLGETGRGKTQIVALIMSVLGSYAHAANPKLLSPSTNEHDAIVFDLKGRRMSFIDEAPRDAKAGQERLKQLTGGGELTGRQMNQNPITFRPTHTLVLTANDEPVLTDPAVRSRVRLIPCDGDPELVRTTRAAIGHVSGAAWRAEAPGVLAQLMAEAGAWLADPTSALVTSAPAHIAYLAEQLGAEQDPVAVWLEEETEPFEQGTPSRELYQAFVASCRRNSMRTDAIPTETKWGRSLTRQGIGIVRTEHGKRRLIRVRPGDVLPGLQGPQTPTQSVEPTVQANCAGTGGPKSQYETNLESATRNPAQLSGNPAQLMHSSEPNCAGTKPQVNPNESVDPAQSAQFESSLRTHTRAHAGVNSRPENAANCAGDPSTSEPKPTRQRSAEATAEAAEKRAAARAKAIAEAAGERVELPALVMRNGSVTAIGIEDVEALLDSITSTPRALTVDVETTGFPVGHPDYALRTIQLGNADFAIVLDATDSDQAGAAAAHLATARILHAHSATADLVPLAYAGLVDLEDAWGRMHDTVIPAKLADPASTGSDPGLKKLATAVLGDQALSETAEAAKDALFKAGKWLKKTQVTTSVERSGWAQVDSSCATMVRYAAADVLDDAALAERLPPVESKVLDRERLAQRMTARVAYHGLRLDAEHVDQLRTEQQAALADATTRLGAFGVENPGSDQQVAVAVESLGVALPRTRTGRPSVASGVLEPYASTDGPLGELVRARLAYQEAENRLGLFLEGYHLAATRGDGRVRPTVYTMEAKTGRMSCVRPNLQQVPREGGYRACITADPGELLISADFSGVELRVAAALSQDPALMAIVADPARDIHAEIARIVWGPGAGKAERYMAKRKVFGRLYGSGINGLVTADPPVSETTARAIVDALDAMTPGLTAWSRSVADGIESGRTRFQTYSGRWVHMPRDRGYAGPNYCIQGTARELLIDALERWSRTRWGSAVLLPVHDELVVKVPEDDAEEATRVLVECMATQLGGVVIEAEPSEPSYAWKDSI